MELGRAREGRLYVGGMWVERERDREREGEGERERQGTDLLFLSSFLKFFFEVLF